MSSNVDYRDSHQMPEKGCEYDRSFRDLRYRRYIWFWEQKVLREILGRFFSRHSTIDYLDFACGTGRLVSFLEQAVSIAYGVDVSESMLEVGRQRVKRAKLLRADLTRDNPFGDKRFDLITAFRFFLNAQPELRQQAMMSLAGLLKPGGYLVFNVHMNHSSLFAKLVRTKRRLLGLNPEGFTTLSHEQIQTLVDSSNLHIVRTYHRGLVPIVNENTRIPAWSFHPLEAIASRIPTMRILSRFVIYVCQRV